MRCHYIKLCNARKMGMTIGCCSILWEDTVTQKMRSQIARKDILYKMKYMLTSIEMRATIKKIHVLDIVGGEYVNEEQRCSD